MTATTLAEFGYDGPALTGLRDAEEPIKTEPDIAPTKPGIWEDRNVYFHAAHRAIINGTARQELRPGLRLAG